MYRTGFIKAIEIEMGDKNIFKVFFDVFLEYPKIIRLFYFPKTDDAKRILYNSRLDTEFLCKIGKNSRGEWKIFNVYQDIEVLKND